MTITKKNKNKNKKSNNKNNSLVSNDVVVQHVSHFATYFAMLK